VSWTGSSDGETTELDEDEAFELLSSSRRRLALAELRAAGGSLALGRLAERVAGQQEGVDPDRVDPDTRKSVYTSLQQFHLPRLDEAGVVEFDADRGEVSATATASRLDACAATVRGDEVPWYGYYAGLTAVGGGVAAALWVDAFPFALLPDPAWLTALVAALVVAAGAHALDARRRGVGAGGGS
jgi:hypothetical protein